MRARVVISVSATYLIALLLVLWLWLAAVPDATPTTSGWSHGEPGPTAGAPTEASSSWLR